MSHKTVRRLECGCILQEDYYGPQIDFCPLHGTAQALLAACKDSLRTVNFRLWQRGAELTPLELEQWRNQLHAAITQAEGPAAQHPPSQAKGSSQSGSEA